MTNLIETPLQTVKVVIPNEDDKNKTKTESTQPQERVVSMKILKE